MLSKVSLFILFLSYLGLTMPVWAQVGDTSNDTVTNQTWLDRHDTGTVKIGEHLKIYSHGLKREWNRQRPMIVYDSRGRQYKPKRGELAQPKLVVDTLDFFGGVATLTLNTQRARGRMTLAARSKDDIHILGIHNVSVDSTVISRTLDTIKVYSSGASDTTVAQIMLMVQ